jgi:hypothetical protein
VAEQGSSTPARAATPSGDLRARAYDVRIRAAGRGLEQAPATHVTNGDEDRYTARTGSFSKGLSHDAVGNVQPDAYASMLNALTGMTAGAFENVPMGGVRRFVNPEAGLGYEMQGPHPHGVAVAPPPAFSSAEEASEIAENYWMAVLRDVPFEDYPSNALAAQAAADLSRLTAFRGPRVDGRVTPEVLFRAALQGASEGPYLSQFFLLDAPMGAESMTRQIRTVLPGIDYLTDYDEWLAAQNGHMPWPDQYDRTPRYMRNGRDLGQWVHFDLLYQAYLEAMLVLFRIGARRSAENPYLKSQNQAGFATLGSQHIATDVCAVAKPAVRATWFQKWFVHRRLRPEEYAGRVHNHLTGRARSPIHDSILGSSVLRVLYDRHRSYLLPQAYPEGCPLHPAYTAGHATVAGACVTVLKAFFDESFVIRSARRVDAETNTLVPYEGRPLTVGGELNKLASNVAMGRNIAGVHWRSDAEQSLRYGEQIAIAFLRDDRDGLHEQFGGYTFTKFDGERITI